MLITPGNSVYCVQQCLHAKVGCVILKGTGIAGFYKTKNKCIPFATDLPSMCYVGFFLVGPPPPKLYCPFTFCIFSGRPLFLMGPAWLRLAQISNWGYGYILQHKAVQEMLANYILMLKSLNFSKHM